MAHAAVSNLAAFPKRRRWSEEEEAEAQIPAKALRAPRVPPLPLPTSQSPEPPQQAAEALQLAPEISPLHSACSCVPFPDTDDEALPLVGKDGVAVEDRMPCGVGAMLSPPCGWASSGSPFPMWSVAPVVVCACADASLIGDVSTVTCPETPASARRIGTRGRQHFVKGQGKGRDEPVNESDETWHQRFVKRNSAIEGVKESIEYKAVADRRRQPGRMLRKPPLTPDPGNRKLSKRQWENETQYWRKGLRECAAELGIVSQRAPATA